MGDDSLYHEFVMGLLDEGEILIDDLRVIEDPDGAATDLLQNGDFSKGTAAWRIIGNHRHSLIEPDPEDPGNPVLRLVAAGPTEHMSNHAETTFAGGRSIQNGQTYEIRFRARWVAGCPQLNTRLFFNRLAKTTILPVPEQTGTPGRKNSRWEANVGPTCSGLKQEPAVPIIRQSVRVTVSAQDPDGVDAVTLWYRPDGNSWRSVAMEQSDDVYMGKIPPYSSGTLIQFYVAAVDGQGQESWCPQAGAESFAQYRVEDGKARTTGVHNYRIVMRDEQRNALYAADQSDEQRLPRRHADLQRTGGLLRRGRPSQEQRAWPAQADPRGFRGHIQSGVSVPRRPPADQSSTDPTVRRSASRRCCSMRR